jgi:hypothetical protein
MDYIGPITPQDIKLFVENPIACTTPYVQKLRHSHHAIARHIASGKRVMEIAQITNYTPHRIHGLQGDPAFIELVSYYRAQVDAAFADAQVKLAMLGGDTIEVLHERLSDDPETFTNRELIALMESTMDRSVAPKKGGAGGVGWGGGGGGGSFFFW